MPAPPAPAAVVCFDPVYKKIHLLHEYHASKKADDYERAASRSESVVELSIE